MHCGDFDVYMYIKCMANCIMDGISPGFPEDDFRNSDTLFAVSFQFNE